jgi:benzylsuccinate CoA-transferase BbsF subunit
MTYPLEGYRVADLGQVWAGPVLAHLLADMGAEVIRIESKAGTDQMRNLARDPSEIRKSLDANFVYRNRTCVTVNFTKPRGAELVKEIVKRCDIVIENFAPRVLRKFGLGYEAFKAVKPDIIMVSMSAAGQDGPYRDLMGYGPSINSLSGVDSLVGYPGEQQLMVNVWDADPTTAVTAAFAVQSALHYRERTGKGQYIDLSFYEGLASLVGEGIMDCSMNKRVALPRGNQHPMMAPHGIYPCAGKDKWVSIAVKTQAEWQAFCTAIGSPKWAKDERFADVFGRLQHREALDDLVAQWTRQHKNYEAMHLLQKHGVAAAIVATLEDVYLDPHDAFRRTSLKIVDKRQDPQDVVYGIPWRLSDTPGAIHKLASPMGADNERIFRGMLNMPKDEYQRLMDEQVIY